jgi:diguanylate cyclase (GGDEF)-like protein
VITAWAVYRTSNLALERQHDANHDQLTGLSNRRVFRDEVEAALQQAARRGQKVAVVLLDLDGFKTVNDQLGHHIGDLVLKEIASRLDGYRRATDGLARLGGDEFGMLLPNDGADTATAVARRLLELVEQPCIVSGFPVSVSGSFGIAVYPHHGPDVDTLIQHADVAMYLAKNTEDRIQTYNGENDRTRRGRFDLLGDLQSAIDTNELVMHYQPKIDLRTGAVTGVEALVRWQHPALGLIPPDEFIGLAEHTDLIGPLTDAVLELAIAQLSDWHRQGIEVTVAVNGSAGNLHDLAFPTRVAEILRRHTVDPRWLELEITENTVVTDPVRTAAVLRALRDMGVQLAIDDFGTGYSSLAHLRQLPVQIVKIDRSFVSDMLLRPEDGVVVRSIIDLAHNLGMTTTAEGVEDSGVLESLTMSGCDGAQAL